MRHTLLDQFGVNAIKIEFCFDRIVCNYLAFELIIYMSRPELVSHALFTQTSLLKLRIHTSTEPENYTKK